MLERWQPSSRAVPLHGLVGYAKEGCESSGMVAHLNVITWQNMDERTQKLSAMEKKGEETVKHAQDFNAGTTLVISANREHILLGHV